MNLFFEESGDLKAGHVLSQAGPAYQVELPSGKRSKVRERDILLQFETPNAATLLEDATQIAEQLDLNFLWEVAGEEEFSFTDLGSEYFGHKPTPIEAAGLLMCLQNAPIHFYKKGKGRYKAAPEASLKAAQAGIEKKRQQAIIQAQYVEELKKHSLPPALLPIAKQLLFKPDKNSIEYKALEIACSDLQTTHQRLMLACHAIDSAKDIHLGKFLFNYFPKGTGFDNIAAPISPDLPLAQLDVFSIDDISTTEIDDAFSLQTLADGNLCIGIHIAAPALGVTPDDVIDALARQRMSTVYMPGDKITMLPDAVIDAFTLRAGHTCPALSLYVTVNAQDFSVIDTQTRTELITVKANLRLNDLDTLVTEENLNTPTNAYPYQTQLSILWQWVQVLEKTRAEKRASAGLKPDQQHRVDYQFYVNDGIVDIVRRKRGAPIDKIVAELMIFTNNTWGKYLHEHNVPGIYRTFKVNKEGWSAKQVRMTTYAAPHAGLGVDHYAWCTSPLRRYTDLVNQWQILACLNHGITAPMLAPFKHNDAQLFSIISAFDANYTAYNDFQASLERYWCLRWLQQHDIKEVSAVALREDLIRLTDIPLVIKVPSTSHLAPGTEIRLHIIGYDELDLTVEVRLIDMPSTAKQDEAPSTVDAEPNNTLD